MDIAIKFYAKNDLKYCQSEGGALPPPNGLFFSCARWNAAGVAWAGIFFFLPLGGSGPN